MADDDFDSDDPAPLPSYDRQWRHPAEHVDAERTRHLATAPPVGRRLLMLTAIVSLLASGSLLFVVVPKGISEYTSGARTDDDTTGPIVKGSTTARTSEPVVVRATSVLGESTAVSLGDGRFLVPLSMIDPDGTVRIVHQGDQVVARVARRFPDAELAVVRSATVLPGLGALRASSIVEPVAAAEIDGHSVVDAWSSIEMHPERSIVTRDSSGDVPIATVDPVHGVGVVVDPRGSAIGVVVRRQHSSWILDRDRVLDLLGAAKGDPVTTADQ